MVKMTKEEWEALTGLLKLHIIESTELIQYLKGQFDTVDKYLYDNLKMYNEILKKVEQWKTDV
jgi:hypothetical protein